MDKQQGIYVSEIAQEKRFKQDIRPYRIIVISKWFHLRGQIRSGYVYMGKGILSILYIKIPMQVMFYVTLGSLLIFFIYRMNFQCPNLLKCGLVTIKF